MHMYGKVFRDARLSDRNASGKHLSLRELSARTGVSRRYLADIESGAANVTLDVLTKVAVALGIKKIRVGELSLSIDAEFIQSVRNHLSDTVRHLQATEELLTSLARRKNDSGLSASDEELVTDLLGVADEPAAAVAETPFLGSYVTAATLPHGSEGLPLWSPHLPFPEELFAPTDFSYPRLVDGGMFSSVLTTSMEPELPRGTLIRIDTRRAAEPGDLLAVHGLVSGSLLGRVGSTGRAVLERTQGSAIEIWKERCVVLGTCALAG
jgi:transcriptional regulator with XRE-family HTH domain